MHCSSHHNDAGIIFSHTLVQKVCPSANDPMLNACILCFEGPSKQPSNLGVTASDFWTKEQQREQETG